MKQLLIDFDKVTQRQLEDYFKAFRELGGKEEGIGLVEYAGAMVRAAVKVRWLDFDVDNAAPKDVMALQTEIQKYVRSVMEFDAKN